MKKTAKRASGALIQSVVLAVVITGSVEAIPLTSIMDKGKSNGVAETTNVAVSRLPDTSISMKNDHFRHTDIEYFNFALDENALIASARLIDTQIT